MPVLVPVGEAIASYNWQCSGDAEVQSVTFGVSHTGAIPEDEWPIDLDSIAGTAGLKTASAFGTDWTYVGCEVRVMTSTGFITYNQPATVVGTRTGSTAPTNVALLVSKLTASGGRKHRGRMYLPAAYVSPSDYLPNGSVLSTRVTALQTIMTALLTNMNTALFQMRLFHADGSTAPTTVTSLRVESRLATQRRRLRP